MYNKFTSMLNLITRLLKSKKFNEWLLVILISIFITVINNLHVIVGFLKTPPGFTYLATGHYFLDYFIYLSVIAQGQVGKILPMNYLSSNDPAIYLFFLPYVLLGLIAWFLRLSPMSIYWIAVFILNISLLMIFYLLIKSVLKKESLFIKLFAFLIAIFSGPFFTITKNSGQFDIIPFDFWYGPSAFIRRFELVPYHLLGAILLGLVIFLICRLIEKIEKMTNKAIFYNSLFIVFFMIFIITFSPFTLMPFLPTLSIISLYYFIKNKHIRFKVVYFNLIIFVIIVPIGFLLKKFSNENDLFQRISALEVLWNEKISFKFLLLNLGPIALFFPFGIWEYLKKDNAIRLVLFLFTMICYILLISPISFLLGTHNLRFLSSLSYVFFASLVVLGMKNISQLFKNKKNIILIIIFASVFLYSAIFNYKDLSLRLSGFDQRTPVTEYTYVPTKLINGIKSLNYFKDNGVILTDPYTRIGILSSIFAHKRAFIGSEIMTSEFAKKQFITNQFFEMKISPDQAKIFLYSNKISYILLTIYDAYDRNVFISHYSFLKTLIDTPTISIWKVTN